MDSNQQPSDYPPIGAEIYGPAALWGPLMQVLADVVDLAEFRDRKAAS